MSSARGWLLAAMVLVGVAALPATVDAQSAARPRIDLVAQTAIVGAEPAVFDLAIDGAPEGARLQVCINLPVTDREELRDAHDDPPRECLVSNFRVDALADIEVAGEPGRYALVIPDEEVGLLLRRDRGALPVVLDLLGDSGVLDTLVTQLLVVELPAEGEPVPAVLLSFVADVEAELAHLPDATVVDTADELVRKLGDFEPVPREAIAVALRPESLAAADTAGGAAGIESIVDVLAAHELLLEPWVGLEEEGWRRAGESETVLGQYADGRTTVEALADRSPTGVVRLDVDATEETVALLRTAGATDALIDEAVLGASALDSADHRPVHLRDDNGIPMRALVIDARLPETLAGTDDLELAAHRALAELVLVAAPGGDRAMVLDLDETDPDALAQLLELAAGNDRIRTGAVTTSLELPIARTSTGAIVEVRLRGEDPSDLQDAAAVQQFTRASIDAYQGMVTTTQAPIVPLRTLLRASVDGRLDDDGRAEYTNAIAAAVTRGTSGITILDSERITLATRTADLPVTVRNEQSVPVTVELVLRAEKLRFPDGDRRTIELEPGDNAITVRVEARASGDARVIAALRSPDGRLDLDETVIPIRSTALSGIGLLISAVALVVLLAWWIRTVRRTRRSRSAATVPASAGAPADQDQEES